MTFYKLESSRNIAFGKYFYRGLDIAKTVKICVPHLINAGDFFLRVLSFIENI